MTTCSRCNGSGTEPDPVAEARARFVEVLTGAQVVIGLKDRFAAAFAAYEAAVRERITVLEEALRDVLHRLEPHGRGGGFSGTGRQGTTSMLQVDHEDVDAWWAIWDGES